MIVLCQILNMLLMPDAAQTPYPAYMTLQFIESE